MVGGPVEAYAMLHESSKGSGQGAAVWVTKGRVIESCGPSRRRPTSAGLPCVQSDVVVVAARAEERGLIAHSLGHLEPEDARVERDGAVQVSDLQVDMADDGPGVDRWLGLVAQVRTPESCRTRRSSMQ